MKVYSVLIVFFLGWSWCVQAGSGNEGIQFFQGSWEEALAQAKDEQKPIFVDAYASWCGPCKRMAANVFTQEEVGAFYNERFINFKIDMEKGEGPEFGKKFPVRAYPTLMFINPREEKIHEHVGGLDGEGLIKTGELALRKYGLSSEYAEKYKEGNRDFEVVLGYLEGRAFAGESNISKANAYLKEHGEELSEDQKLQIAYAGATEADSKLFDRIMENIDRLFELREEEEILERVEKACNATVEKAIQFQAPFLLEEAIDKFYEFERKRGPREAFAAGAQLRYYATHPNWKEYERHLEHYLGTQKGSQLTERKRIGYEMLEVYGAQSVDAALDLWEEIAEEESDVADNHFQLAQLYHHASQQKKAAQSIEKAIAIAEESGEDKGRYIDLQKEIRR